ncbi:hypothetical protein Hanom_Chr14g01336861 [Helianthus anomalus]
MTKLISIEKKRKEKQRGYLLTYLGRRRRRRRISVANSINDTAPGRIISTNFNFNFVPWEHPYGIASDFARDVAQNHVAVF